MLSVSRVNSNKAMDSWLALAARQIKVYSFTLRSRPCLETPATRLVSACPTARYSLATAGQAHLRLHLTCDGKTSLTTAGTAESLATADTASRQHVLGGGGLGRQHKRKQLRGCTTARDYDIMESGMHRGLQDDVARAAHAFDACPSAATSEPLPQLQVRCCRSYK